MLTEGIDRQIFMNVLGRSASRLMDLKQTSRSRTYRTGSADERRDRQCCNRTAFADS